ncbi:MAG TPA: tetratricopeptide repeat protein [Chloroflexia bacterium]|nr:tetratricopeptide repeat protein [Chloroflexia bacterium]
MPRDMLEAESPGARHPLAAVLSVLLVAGLALSVVWALNDARQAGRFSAARGEALLREGRYSEAVSVLERTLTTFDSTQLRIALSQGYLARRDAERSERQARIALDRAARTPQLVPAAWAQLGRALAFAGRDGEALDAWARAVEEASWPSAPTDVTAQARSALWHAAVTRWRAGEWGAARAVLEALAAGDDVYGESARLKLAQLLAPDEPDTARQLLASSTLTPTNGPAIPDLNVPDLGEGLTPEQSGFLRQTLGGALDQAAFAHSTGASRAALDTLWGAAYLQQGETDLARRRLAGALSLDPGYAPANSQMALLLLTAGDREGALRRLETAIRLDPDDPLPHDVLARVHMAAGDWEAAEAELKTLQSLQPAAVEPHMRWAEYYRLRGEYDLAEDAYIEASNLQMAGADAAPGTDASLTLALFYTDVRGFGCERGLPAAQRSLNLHPGKAASLDAVGWALMLCGRAEDTLVYLEGAVKAAPLEPRYRFHLARAYRDLGRTADARAQYLRVVDLDPGGPLERFATSEMIELPPDDEATFGGSLPW